MKIEVTQYHIDNGSKAHACLCPIALAISDATGVDDIRVNYTTAMVTRWFEDKEPVRTHYHMPTEASQFVDRYDTGDLVSPFEFELVEMVR